MRVKKTKQSDRGVYRYPVQVEDGRGGYRTAYNVIKPGEDGITEVWGLMQYTMILLKRNFSLYKVNGEKKDQEVFPKMK